MRATTMWSKGECAGVRLEEKGEGDDEGLSGPSRRMKMSVQDDDEKMGGTFQ